MEDGKLIITRNLKVGALDAETDTKLLDSCFVDKGDVDELIDVNNPASLILGRTGAGKSALIYKLTKDTDKNIRLDPNDISIRFLEHSNIIGFFDALDIKLDIFYKLLWRHLLTVEFLKLRYSIKSEIDGKDFVTNILNKFSRDKAKKKAIEYFNDWGDKFWLDTDEHLKEITSKLEKDTKASIGTKYSDLSLNLEGLNKLSDQERTEVKQRASQVVDGLQIKKLNEVLVLIKEHSFDDPQKRFYIIIDQLDEDWADTNTRYRFIRALIEEIKSFRKIPAVKIIAAIRKDLLDIVFDKTRDSGFQEEKYESYILELKWSTDQLKKLVELRINEVFKSQYTNGKVSIDDVFPKPRKGGGQTPLDYIIERTLRRPRDVLQFINESFSVASDRERISWRALQAAEAQYSEKRLKSLREEWSQVYPALHETIEILRGVPVKFTRSILTASRLDDVVLAIYQQNCDDPCVDAVQNYFTGKGNKEFDVIAAILTCLYRIGAIGIKISTVESFVWSFIDQPTVSVGEIKRSNKLKVHKMLHRSLDIHLEHNDAFEEDAIS